MKAMRLMIVVFLVAAPCSLVSAAGGFDIQQILTKNFPGKNLDELISGNSPIISSPFAALWNQPDQSIVQWHWKTKVKDLKELRQALAEYAMANNKYNVPLNSYGSYLLHFLAEDYDVLKTTWEKLGNEDKLKPTLNHLNSASKHLGGPKTPLDVALQEFDLKAAEFLIGKGAAIGDVDAKILQVFSDVLTNAESYYNSNETKAGIATLKLLIQKGASADTLEKTVKADVARKYSEYWYKNDSSDTRHQDAGNKIFAELKTSGSSSGGGSGPSSGSFDIAQILLNDPYKGKDVAESIGSLWDHPDSSIVQWHWKTKVKDLKELRQALAEYAMANNKYDVPLDSKGNYLLHFLAEDFDVLKTIWEKPGNEAKLKPTLEIPNKPLAGGIGGPKTPLDVALTEYNAKAVEFLIDKGAKVDDVNDSVVKVINVGIHEFVSFKTPEKMAAIKETLVVLFKHGADVDKVKEKLAADKEIWWWQDPTHKGEAEKVLAEAKALAAAGSGHGGGGGGSGPSSGSATPLDDLKTALEGLKAKLAALATALKP